MWTWLQATSTALYDAANLAVILDPLALSKKDSQIRAYQCTRPNTVVEPGAIPGAWTDVCGFIKSTDSCENWKVRLHGAFTIPHDTLDLHPKDQSCHHEVWLHLDLVGNQYAHESRGNMSSGSSSKEGPLHTRLTRRKTDMTMKATAHFHLCRLYENLC